jgi:hypothetical protein
VCSALSPSAARRRSAARRAASGCRAAIARPSRASRELNKSAQCPDADLRHGARLPAMAAVRYAAPGSRQQASRPVLASSAFARLKTVARPDERPFPPCPPWQPFYGKEIGNPYTQTRAVAPILCDHCWVSDLCPVAGPDCSHIRRRRFLRHAAYAGGRPPGRAVVTGP